MRRLVALLFVLLLTGAWQQERVVTAQSPTPNLDRIPIRWVDVVDPTDLANVVEPAVPFIDMQANARLPTDKAVMWSTFVAPVGGDAVLMNTSKRLSNHLSWEGERRLVWDFHTRFTSDAGRLVWPWQGKASIDVTAGVLNETLDPSPCKSQYYLYPWSGSRRNRYELDCDRAGERQFLRDSNNQILVRDSRSGRARRPEGISQVLNLGLLSDGTALYGNSPSIASDLYMVPMDGDEALLLHDVARYSLENREAEPSRGRVLIATRPASAACCAATLWLYTGATNTLRHVGQADVTPQTAFAWLGENAVVDGRLLLNLRTGPLTPYDPPKPEEPVYKGDLYGYSEVSPDGSLLIRGLHGTPWVDLAAKNPCEDAPGPLQIEDTTTHAVETVWSCASGFQGDTVWLNNQTVLVTRRPRCQCDNPAVQYFLFRFPERVMYTLNPAYRGHNRVIPSPDGMKLLVYDERLALYNLDGSLIRDYGPPPEGHGYLDAAWSPDGQLIAFRTGPDGWYGI